MKKILTILLVLASFGAHARDFDHEMQRNLLTAFSVLSVMAVIIFFIITFLQRILDHRLRNKIIDKGITDTLAASLLKTKPKDDKTSTLKWVCLLGGTAAGLMTINYLQPFGLHSLAIMAFSIALGFLGYYFVLKNADK